MSYTGDTGDTGDTAGTGDTPPGLQVTRVERIEFEAFARVCDIHPELLARLVDLGVIEVETDDEGALWMQRRQVAVLARVRRLRSGLGLSYSAIAVVGDLIDRVDELETALRWYEANSPRNRAL